MVGENDNPFECVLKNSGNIDVFVDEFFSFLARRTDFFLECPPGGGSFGFPEGHAKRIIQTKFEKWKSFRHQDNNLPNLTPLETKFTENTLTTKPDVETKTKPPVKKLPTHSSSEAYNGKATDKYTWSQTIAELDIKIPISDSIKRGKDIKVTILADSIYVALASTDKLPLFEGKLPFPIIKDESYWNLLPGEAIHIWLQKAQERWWTALVEGEDPIDLKSIEAVRPMEELKEEEQMKIQELMWNQERKQKGLPTSDEMKVLKTLESAWNLEGSPFKGQPFDPSMVDLSNSKPPF